MDTIRIPTETVSAGAAVAAAPRPDAHRVPPGSADARQQALDALNELLYRTGFWLEYMLLCAGRTAVRSVRAIAGYAGGLVRVIARPLAGGIAGVLQDMTQPFVTLYRALRQLARTGLGAGDLPAATLRARRRRVAELLLRQLLRGVLALALPLAAAGVLVLAVQRGTARQFVLDVQMNGQSVGSVANEQVFESACSDVQERLNNAHTVLLAAGLEPGADTQWEVMPTYALQSVAAGDTAPDVMSEGELADALMRMASTDIGEATAVYVDDELRFVTTEGDHLRAYLENYKTPAGTTLEPDTSVDFLHSIDLVDGLYMNSSVVPYSDIVSTFKAGAEVYTYTAAEGETVQTAVNNTGVSFDSLAMMNPGLQSIDQIIRAPDFARGDHPLHHRKPRIVGL